MLKKKKDEQKYYNEEHEKKYTSLSPSTLGIFNLGHSKRIMNNFILAVDGIKKPNIYYSDTDSIYVHLKHFEKLNNSGYVGNKLSQGKNDYVNGGIIYGLYLAPKIKFNIVIEDYILKYKYTFKGCPKNNINFEAYLRLKEGKEFQTTQKKPWSKSLENGITIYDDDDLIEKIYDTNINVLKRKTPDNKGIMYPYHFNYDDLKEQKNEEYNIDYNKVIFDPDYNCLEDNDKD